MLVYIKFDFFKIYACCDSAIVHGDKFDVTKGHCGSPKPLFSLFTLGRVSIKVFFGHKLTERCDLFI